MKRMPVPKYYETKTFDSINDFFVSCNLVREKYNVHQHEYYELELIIEGESVHTLNTEKCTLSKGDIVFITPMDRHGYEKSFFRTITIHFSAAYLSTFFKNALSQSENRIIRHADSQTLELFAMAHKVFVSENEQFKEIKIKNIVELILLNIMPDSFSNVEKHTSSGDRLSEAIGYINVNFTSEITLSDIESKFGLSSSYFSHAFKKRVGKTFVNYIAEKRIEYAKKLLATGEKVIDTCYECGFNSERNFSRRFKEYTGITPNDYKVSQKTTE